MTSADGFRFTIDVTLHSESDPDRAIEWMLEHMVVSLKSIGLPILGTAPDGTSFLWMAQLGKPPRECLTGVFPPEATL